MRRQRIYLACFLLHFLLIVTISCRETLWLIAHGLTMLPSPVRHYSAQAETIASAALAQNLPATSEIRRALLSYFHIAGIERGYGYFAPNVPGTYKLLFELHYPDGKVESQSLGGNTASSNLRLSVLVDEIGGTRVNALREYLLKTLARSTWREHPNVKTVRAIVAARNLRSIDEFEHGMQEPYEFLYAYDFSLGKLPAEAETP